MLHIKSNRTLIVNDVKQIFKFNFEWEFCQSKLLHSIRKTADIEAFKDFGLKVNLMHYCICHNKFTDGNDHNDDDN